MLDPCWKPGSGYERDDFTHYLKQDINWFGEAMAVIMIAGAIASALPQIITLAIKKTSHGISGSMLFFQALNQVFYISNMTMVQFNRVAACGNSFKKCWANGFLNWFQPILLGIGCGTYYVQYLVFRMREAVSAKENTKKIKIEITGFTVVACVMLLILGLLVYSGVYYGECNKVYSSFAMTFSIIGAIFSMFMYVPQIVKIVKNKSPGSYSIVSVSIMAVGGIATVVTFFMNSVDWTSYIVTVAPLIQQVIILILVIVLAVRKRRARLAEAAKTSENRALLESDAESSGDSKAQAIETDAPENALV